MRLRTAAVLLAALTACSHGHVSWGGDAHFGKTAEDDYQYGLDELKDGHADYAAKFFDHIRSRYPFSKYAALAELGLADAKFQQSRWPEAAEAYESFLKLHPNHEKAEYAAFRAGLARWRDGPSTFFALPPPEEKDLASVRDAEKALADFVKKYPDSPHHAEGVKLLAQARALLVKHEWYVVDFYRGRGRWPGAAARLEGIARDYPEIHPGETLYALAESYEKMGERYKAQQALQELIVKHPDSPQRPSAEKLLASLRGR